MYARNLRTHRKRQSENGSERRKKNEEGNQGQTGGHGGVVEAEAGGEDEDHVDTWFSTGKSFSVSRVRHDTR